MVCLKEVVVLCDKTSDQKIFKDFQKSSTILSQIDNVEVLPINWKEKLPEEYLPGMAPLLEFDRADYYFCYDGYPFLVVEMTVHGYTGDNSLQRFARISKTAQEGIPLIYFSPHSRNRHDELGRAKPSSRNVSSDLFKGFVRLSEIYKVPVVAVEWTNNEKGIPVDLLQTDKTTSGVKSLLTLIESLLTEKLDALIKKEDIMTFPPLKDHFDKTLALGGRGNVRPSEIRVPSMSYSQLIDIVDAPMRSLDYIPREYFMKGKSQKLISLLSIESSHINKLVLPDGNVIKINSRKDLLENLPDELSNKPWLFFHSGYQWRSEPNVGIVTNIDITLCRSNHGKTNKDRDILLAVHWPRVFFEGTSDHRSLLLSQLEDKKTDSPFMKLIAEKSLGNKGNKNGERFITFQKKNVGAWNERATVARVYRNTCDLLILNDAVILGNMWLEDLK